MLSSVHVCKEVHEIDTLQPFANIKLNSPPIIAANEAGEVGPQGFVPLSGLEEDAGASGLGRRMCPCPRETC